MALLTLDEIKEKAPDRKSFANAKKVADPSNWTSLGRQPDVLWGVTVGSRGDEYKVYVDVSRDALECSCPSRKRPCKHALALLVLDANGHEIPEAAAPQTHKWEAEERYQTSWE